MANGPLLLFYCFSTSLPRFPEDFSFSPTTCAAFKFLSEDFLKISICVRRSAQRENNRGTLKAAADL
ncbi:hypothetical protein H5410_011944 [Solanum commersonii]|uniref:Uncharacterized protein n=1 Tax=Solanum commersonii TaxID=4109 RepID=A0A9J6AQ66_SOLCO|nr:hypothetical protein H5410_011944 [Solanum commersonii]